MQKCIASRNSMAFHTTYAAGQFHLQRHVMVTTMFNKPNSLVATHSAAVAGSLSAPAIDTCPDLKAIYLLIFKAACITGVLGWLFIAGPLSLAGTAAVDATHTEARLLSEHMIDYE